MLRFLRLWPCRANQFLPLRPIDDLTRLLTPMRSEWPISRLIPIRFDLSALYSYSDLLPNAFSDYLTLQLCNASWLVIVTVTCDLPKNGSHRMARSFSTIDSASFRFRYTLASFPIRYDLASTSFLWRYPLQERHQTLWECSTSGGVQTYSRVIPF